MTVSSKYSNNPSQYTGRQADVSGDQLALAENSWRSSSAKGSQNSNGDVKVMSKGIKSSLYHYISSKRLNKENAVLIGGWVDGKKIIMPWRKPPCLDADDEYSRGSVLDLTCFASLSRIYHRWWSTCLLSLHMTQNWEDQSIKSRVELPSRDT